MLQLLSLLLVASNAFECVYEVDNGLGPAYTLNLTEVSEWTLELAISSDEETYKYYHTPCRNDIYCSQGNANFSANVAQYEPEGNQCHHYLSVDHKQTPTYSSSAAAFIFNYEDGEICEITQAARQTTIYWACAINGPTAYMDRVQEISTCDYHISYKHIQYIYTYFYKYKI